MMIRGILLATLVLTSAADAQSVRPRARDLGVPFDGSTGPLNAITDVAGVEVGHATLVSGSGRLVRGQGPVRTGVTAVLPRGRTDAQPVFAAWFPLNGNGEMTGTTWIDESGQLDGPVLITNTHSVGVVRDAAIEWRMRRDSTFLWALPVVAETYDGVLNDINGFHVKPQHVFDALDGARGGAVTEGAVGGGTGMLCNGFKGGIGTSSRLLSPQAGGYTVGVLVQCNYGSRNTVRVGGVPLGPEFTEATLCAAGAPPSQAFLRGLPRCAGGGDDEPQAFDMPELGSIIIVVATDAPLLPHQLERLVKRATLGLGRNGAIASNGSGDIFVAFSTANTNLDGNAPVQVTMLPNDRIDALFHATVQATEEAVINAMVAADTTTGADDVRAYGLPHERIREIMRKYNRSTLQR